MDDTYWIDVGKQLLEIVYLINMESILVHPENADQLNALKAFLKASNMDFESKEDNLPQHVLESIERGKRQIANGQSISLEEFKAKHFIGK